MATYRLDKLRDHKVVLTFFCGDGMETAAVYDWVRSLTLDHAAFSDPVMTVRDGKIVVPDRRED